MEKSHTMQCFVYHVNELADINGKLLKSINKLIYVMKRSLYHMKK